MHEDVDQSIGNDFFDFGGGNSRSRLATFALVNLISIETRVVESGFLFWSNCFQAAAVKALSICQAEGM
jgi:hypothetical protein